jgi:hypothetical protein
VLELQLFKESRSTMAAKKTPKTISKSDFIRQQPASMSGPQVVAKAKAAGLKLSSQLVYAVRGRAKPRKAAAASGKAKSAGAPRATKSKAEFVRALPSSTPAKEVVAKAKSVGMKLTTSYVYNVRGAAKTALRQGRKGASVPRPITTASSAESLLKAVGAELGLADAIAILSAERARVRAAIGA